MPQFRLSGVQSDDVKTHVAYASSAAAEEGRTAVIKPRREQRCSTSSGRDSSGAPAAHGRGAAQQRSAKRPAGSASTGIPASGVTAQNVGYRLLKQAGWSEGQGLGAREQGRTEPLLATAQKGNQGLGFSKNDPLQQHHYMQRKRGREQQPFPAEAEHQQQKQQRPRRPKGQPSKAVAALVEAEMKAESVDLKVAQYKQAERQEAEDNKLRAIRQYLHRALNEPSMQETADSNPLLRHSRLTASNPLLD